MTNKGAYHIITFGCQMNKSDSERIETVLIGMGMESVSTPEESDVIILNSCSVRAASEHRIFGFARNFLELKKRNHGVIVCVTGCMPGRDKDCKMKTKLHGVDLYFPIHELARLPRRLAELNPKFGSFDDIEENYLNIRPTYNRAYQAFVPIQTGCNQFCAYCVVPYARGHEVNRPVKDILSEARELAYNGSVEVTLLGQIVNHYVAPDKDSFSPGNPYKTSDFAKLLWEVDQIDGIKRIHWTGSHPLYMDLEVIDALTALPNQMNFLHLPAQSGNDEILEKMNRKHNRELFKKIIEKVRVKKPDMAIGTDLILGFCGETKEQFQDTMNLFRECDLDIAYTAQYSERSGTIAAKKYKDDVPKEEKLRRWHEFQEMMESVVYKKNQKYAGKLTEVLVEKCDKGVCSGNSREMKLVQFSGNEGMIGTLQKVKIEKAETWVLYGVLFN